MKKRFLLLLFTLALSGCGEVKTLFCHAMLKGSQCNDTSGEDRVGHAHKGVYAIKLEKFTSCQAVKAYLQSKSQRGGYYGR